MSSTSGKTETTIAYAIQVLQQVAYLRRSLGHKIPKELRTSSTGSAIVDDLTTIAAYAQQIVRVATSAPPGKTVDTRARQIQDILKRVGPAIGKAIPVYNGDNKDMAIEDALQNIGDFCDNIKMLASTQERSPS